jgi:hypothetical protein
MSEGYPDAPVRGCTITFLDDYATARERFRNAARIVLAGHY